MAKKQKKIKGVTYPQLIKALCAMEGKKIQVPRSQIQEVVRCLVLIEAGYMVAWMEGNMEVGVDGLPMTPLRLLLNQAGPMARKTALERRLAPEPQLKIKKKARKK